jgi:hypothetical protein
MLNFIINFSESQGLNIPSQTKDFSHKVMVYYSWQLLMQKNFTGNTSLIYDLSALLKAAIHGCRPTGHLPIASPCPIMH